MSNYNVKTIARTAVPRSKRLREGAAPEGGTTGSYSLTGWHTHSNKDALDLLRYDSARNVVYVGDEDNRVSFAAYGNVAAGGIGSEGGGGGGAKFLYQLEDIYNNGPIILRADGTARQNGDALAYDSAQNKWVASPIQSGASSFAQLTGSPYDNTNLATVLNNKQDAISDLATIRTRADEGHTAYGWGNHANAGYLTGITSSMVTTALGYTPYNAANIGSASVAYSTSAGNASTLENHSASYFASAASLGNYLPVSFYDLQNLTRHGNGVVIALNQDVATETWFGFQHNGNFQGFIGVTDSNTPAFMTPSLSMFPIYYPGNCNNTSTPWSASSLTLSSGLIFSSITDGYRLIISPTGDILDQSLNIQLPATSGSWNVFNGVGAGRTSIFTVTRSGNVGIGTTSLSEKLYVEGNIVASGNVAAGSDARWKHNICPVFNGLNAIMKLQPSEWEWNSDGRKDSGLVAQQVRGVLPHLVKENNDGFLHLNYNGLHAYEISALQNHESRIEQLERENAEMKRMLNINS